MRVLVIEDSEKIRRAVVAALRQEGYAVDEAADGRRGLIHLRTTDYDAAILDIMLPSLDGLSILAQAREKGVRTPVLMLTARDTISDRVQGLRTGADDYLVKPFAIEELLARVAALTRRAHGQPRPIITAGPVSIDTAAKSASVHGETLTLSRREYAILEFLALRKGEVVGRSQLEEHIYDDRSTLLSNAIDSAISILRRKLAAAGAGDLIRTRRGLGYTLMEESDVDP